MADEDEGPAPTLLGSSAVMAAGTTVSRLTGYLRNALLAAALGLGLHADIFNFANTIPNSLYILLAGGVFNAVLVPQLVRAMRNDEDRGEAYTNRIVTLAAAFLLVATVLLVIAAPLVMRVVLAPPFFQPGFEAQSDSAIAFARYCLPQVFFYGMFVLVGQILNARGTFGPMMWAPIANNVVSSGVIVTYLLTFGQAQDLLGGFSAQQEALLGIGSTAGIVVQFLLLIPYVRSTGYRFRPRWDFRHTGLGHTLRLSIWSVLFVVVNQIAYIVITRIASGGAGAAAERGTVIAGYTVYTNTVLFVMVPHSVVTVSLGTALLPQISAYVSSGDLGAARRELARILRVALSVTVPVTLLLPVVAKDLVSIVWGYGAAADYTALYVSAIISFAPALVFFSIHHLVLRGFYALERNRTVFWIQSVVAATDVILAFAFAARVTGTGLADALALAYGAAYLLGAAISYLYLRQALHGLETGKLLVFTARILLLGAVATLAAWGTRELLDVLIPSPEKLVALLRLFVIGGVDVLVVLVGARIVGPDEIVDMEHLVRARVRRR